jgi:hypothetical protein
MISNLSTLSGEIQGDFHADNRDQYAARRGIMVAQGPDYDVVGGGETGDGFGYGATLTTSSTMMIPQVSVGNLSWFPVAHRGLALGIDESLSSGAHDAPHAMGTGPGGSDTNSIIFSKTAWDAARTDLEEWLADITNFETFLGTNKGLGFGTLQSYDEGKGIFWLADGPYLSPTRGSTYDNDDCYYIFVTSGTQLTIYWNSCVGLDVTANQNEFEFFISWKKSGTAEHGTTAGSRGQAFSANSGSQAYTASQFDSGGGEGYAMLSLKCKATDQICQVISLRGATDPV